MSDTIRIIDPQTNPENFTKAFADALIFTQDGKILLQKRPQAITAFGGHIEDGETPLQGLIRELHEELGAQASTKDVVPIGAVTESFTNHTEIIYLYFWHDRNGTITGCYEWESVEYDTAANALSHPAIMDYLRWLLLECHKRGLIT